MWTAHGDKKKIDERVNQIKAEYKNSTSDYDKEKLQERMAALSGGVGVIKVGAFTETEMKAKKFKIEDALNRHQGGRGRGNCGRRRRGFGQNRAMLEEFGKNFSVAERAGVKLSAIL